MTDPFLQETTALLERTPRVVRELLEGLPTSWLGTPDKADGWTPRDVVGHLISAELEGWIPRVKIILEHGPDQPFTSFDRFAHVERDREASLPEGWTDTPDTADGWRPRDVVGHLITGEETDWISRTRRILEQGTSVPFDRFNRVEMLNRDAGLPLDDLVERFAVLRAENLAALDDLVSDADLDRHGLHPSLGEVTLRELLATWAVHDLDHLAQSYAALAGSHDLAVGPWKAYLGILLRRDDPSAQPG